MNKAKFPSSFIPMIMRTSIGNILWITLLTFTSSFSQDLSDEVSEFVNIKDSVFAITEVTLIDGTGGAIKTNQDVLIVKGKIHAINSNGQEKFPEGTRIIDGKGKTLIPGLIMLHEHLFYGKPYNGKYKAVHMTYTFPPLYLAGGVTTMRTAGSLEANADLNIKNLIDAGKVLGPNIDVTTPHIEREGFIPQLQSLYGDESPERMIDFYLDKGMTSVKVYNEITKDDLKRIVQTAHARNVKVTGHLCSITYREAAEIGIDNLEHGFMVASDFIEDKEENQCDNRAIGRTIRELNIDDPRLESLMRFLIEKDVTITYTPTVFEPFTGREVIPGGGHVALAPYIMEQMQAIYDANANSKRDSLELIAFKDEMERIRKFSQMGGKVVVGTDPTGTGKTIPGYANQRMIELLKETGFNLEESIKIASLDGAAYLEMDQVTGSIEVGKKADLVLIDGDLTEQIENIRKMELVFKDGVGFDSKRIFESIKGKVGLY